MSVGGMEFRLSSDRFAKSYYAFGYPSYDDQDFNVVRDGVWTVLTFSFGQARVEGKPDRSKINSIGWYVADKAGNTPITAYWGGWRWSTSRRRASSASPSTTVTTNTTLRRR